nr:hypothetical protein [Thioalkalivibrio sp. ALJ24]
MAAGESPGTDAGTGTTARLRLQPAVAARPGTPAWDGHFPERLPGDWQLAYLGHFRSRVLLPGVLADDATVAAPFGDWDEAVPPNLRLTLVWPRALPVAAGAQAVVGLAGELGERLDGVLFAPGVDASAARAALHDAGLERLMLAGPGEARELAGVERACWYPCLAGGEGPGVWHVTPAGTPDPAGWRAVVEALAGVTPAGPVPVFLDASPGVLDDVRTIAKLLGWGP